MIQVGKYVPAQELIQRESYGQGFIFKDGLAYIEHPDQVCYIPELSDNLYTHNDFLNLCNGQEELARTCFYCVDWQAPETWIDEAFIYEELRTCPKCGHWEDAAVCSNCGEVLQ